MTQRKKEERKPVVRLRFVGFVAVTVGLLILGPLFTVWKQVYVRSTSIHKETLLDSLGGCRNEIARLRLLAGTLSATPRIERIARERLDLHYPASTQMVIVRPREIEAHTRKGRSKFLAILRKSITRGEG